MNRSRTPILLAVLALSLAACAGGDGASTAASEAAPSEAAASEAAPSEAAASEAAGGGTTVTMADFAYDTDEVTVGVGEVITYVNSDSAAHTVTEGSDGVAADDAAVDEEVEAGAEVEVSFDEAGTYQITCLFHPEMNMTVIVEG
jgi:plastocyanin